MKGRSGDRRSRQVLGAGFAFDEAVTGLSGPAGREDTGF
jgi:hypothetical protein